MAATILIVDDEPYNVDYLQQNLSDLGYRTREAYGGREALDAVAEEAPDLILLDVMMPDIDGITVCRMLKGDPATQLIPIVIMTALDGQEDRIRGIEAGADDFLTKPVDDRELLARINAALRIKQAVDERVDELASATQQLEGLGARVEEAAVIAIEFRSEAAPDSDSPGGAHDYLLARYAEAASSVLKRFGAEPIESDGDRRLFMLHGGDPGRAVDAAQAVLTEAEALNRTNTVQPLLPSIAVYIGEVEIEPQRIEGEASARWAVSVSDAASEQALAMLDDAADGEVLVGEAGSDRPAHRQVRMLATILVSDLVGSTEIAVELGDRAWTEALDGHYRLVRGTFAQYDGEEISTSGDGFLALFDSPAKAIEAGLAIAAQSGEMGLPVRVGIHTGELERTGPSDVQGIAVHLAARVSAEAGAGQVLVTSTTRDAVAGSGLRFTDEGERTMKGIDGARRVFQALPNLS